MIDTYRPRGRRLTEQTYVVYATEYPDTSIIVTDLTPGYTYAFVVQSRNAVGLSDYSNEMVIRAA